MHHKHNKSRHTWRSGILALVPAWQGVSRQNHTQFTLPATPGMLGELCQLSVSVSLARHPLLLHTCMFAEMSVWLSLDRSVPPLYSGCCCDFLVLFCFLQRSAPGRKGNEDNPSVVSSFESTVKKKIELRHEYSSFLYWWDVFKTLIICSNRFPYSFGGRNYFETLRCCNINHQE